MKKKKLILYRVLRFILVPFFKLFFLPKYENREVIPKKGNIVLAGDHISNLDAPLLISATNRPIHFLGKIELFKKGILSWFFHSVGVIPVDRKQKKNHQAMQSAESVLNSGEMIGIFPEGTTRKDHPTMRPFKLGAVAMANHTNSLIIPFAITGKYRFLRRGVKITFGKPFDVSNLELEEANKLLEKKVLELMK